MQARYPGTVKRVQFVTFTVTFAANANVQASENAALGVAVVPENSLVEIVGEAPSYYGTGASTSWQGWFGAELTDANTVALYKNYTSASACTSKTVYITVQVTEFYERPKSLQKIAGNGADSQTITSVDTAKARVVQAFKRCNPSASTSSYLASLAATQVIWGAALDSYASRYQVVEQ